MVGPITRVDLHDWYLSWYGTSQHSTEELLPDLLTYDDVSLSVLVTCLKVSQEDKNATHLFCVRIYGDVRKL